MRSPLEIFEDVVDRPPEERRRHLDRLCAGDPGLRDTVERMLAADARADGLDPSDLQEALAADIAHAERPAHATADLPDRIGSYRVLRILGSGGMGVVYEAEEDHPRRKVALKVLHEDLGSPALNARFRAEAQTVAELRHPAVPTLYAAGEVDGRPWLAMELVEGAQLHHAAVGRPLRVRLRLLEAICEAIEAAHARGVLHCDLKPSNVIVDAAGRPWVLDFGLASTTRRAGERTGTRAFMAPEQQRGDPLGPTVDVFALGRVGHQILPDADGDLRAVLTRATAADPADRYPTVHALRDELVRVAQHRPVAAAPASAAHRLRLFTRRHRRAFMAGAMLVLGAAMVVGGGETVATWEEARRNAAREQAAQARLDRLADRLADPAETTLFEAFAHLPENQGTRALALAWLMRGDALLRANRSDEGLRALAEAYIRAPSPEIQQDALEQLGEDFIRHGAWGPLSALLAGGHVSEPLRRRLAAGTQDLSALPGPLSAWGHGTRLEARAYRIDVDPWRDGTIVVFDQDRGVIEQRRAAPGVPIVRTWALPDDLTQGFSFPAAVAAQPGTFLMRDRAWRPALWRPDAAPAPIGMGPETLLSSASDASTVYLGTGGARGRRLRAFGPGGLGAPSPTLDAQGSDVTSLALADLDGDGTSELIVGQGPWHAYAVTVLRRSGDDWAIDATLQLGNVEGVATLRTPRGTRIAATVHPIDNRLVFGDDQPGGRPRGVYVLAWRPGSLEVAQAIEPLVTMPASIGPIRVGDLDGDGDDDLIVGGADTTDFAWPLLQGDDGSLQDLPVLYGIHPLGLVNVDDDAPFELLARAVRDDHHAWVLGSGDAPFPRLTAAATAPPPRLDWSPRDDALRPIWEGVHQLVDLGLRASAADVLLDAAPLAAVPDDADGFRVRAADLLLDGGRVDAARRALVGLAPSSPVLAARAHDIALRAAMLDRDLQAAEALAPDPAVRARLAAELHWSALPATVPWVDLLTPALWRTTGDPSVLLSQGRASVDVFAHQEAVAATTFVARDGTLGLRMDLDLTDAEFGATLQVLLLPPEGRGLGFIVDHTGGGIDTARGAGCYISDNRTVQHAAPHRRGHVGPERLRLRLEWLEASGHVVCAVEGPDGELWREESLLALPDVDGPWTLAILGEPASRASMSRLRAQITRLEVRGAAPAPPAALRALGHPPTGLGAAHRAARRDPQAWLDEAAPLDADEVALFAAAWSEAIASHGAGDLPAAMLHPALDALDPRLPGAPSLLLGRAVSLYDAGRVREAAQVLDALLPQADDLTEGYAPASRARGLRIAIARQLGDVQAERVHTAAFAAPTLTEAQRLRQLETWIRIVEARDAR